jgi:general secretion pathway protein G
MESKNRTRLTPARLFLLFALALFVSFIGLIVKVNFFGPFGVGPPARYMLRADKDFEILTASLEAHRKVSGRYPSTEEGLNALMERHETPTGRWIKTLDQIPSDPWGNPYSYRLTLREGAEVPEVLCCGRDGMLATEDDLSSLDPK